MEFKLNLRDSGKPLEWEVWEEAHDPRTEEMDELVGHLYEDDWAGEIMFRANEQAPTLSMSDLCDIIRLSKLIEKGDIK